MPIDSDEVLGEIKVGMETVFTRSEVEALLEKQVIACSETLLSFYPDHLIDKGRASKLNNAVLNSKINIDKEGK